MHVFVEGPSRKLLKPNETYEIAINFAATLDKEPLEEIRWRKAKVVTCPIPLKLIQKII